MSKRKRFREQDELEEREIFTRRNPVQEALDSFFSQGLITRVTSTIKSGKESTVYCCEAGQSAGMELLAAKIYRSRNNRGFKNDAFYQEGRVILDTHVRRAVQKKSRFGRDAQFAMWVNEEFEIMQTLYRAGSEIPRPVARSEHAILMEYLGDQHQAAPALQYVELAKDEIIPTFDVLMHNIALWLANNYIHADLSAYNILYWQGQTKIIDFPQAVDPRFNSNALALLTRDIDNVCRYFGRYGLSRDGQRIAEDLWYRFENAEL